MLDSVAKRYGVLPSTLLETGDTLDLMIFDVAVNYEIIQNAKANKQQLSQDMLTREVGKDKLESLKEKYYGKK